MFTPTNEDKCAVLARYRVNRTRHGLPPHAAMHAVATGLAAYIARVIGHGGGVDAESVRRWQAADAYAASIVSRPDYWWRRSARRP